MNVNYYQILGLENFATEEEVKKKYKELVLKHHPDKGGEAEMFNRIKEAYDILKDQKKKEEFDNDLYYQIDVVDKAEPIKLEKGEYNFRCIQCHSQCVLNYDSFSSTNANNAVNLYKCEDCSMVYKITI